MSGIQLTYDAVEDRVLLLSHQDVKSPSWWLSRRAVKAIIHNLNSAVMAQYETEKILQRVVHGGSDAEEGGSQSPGDEDFESYRKGMLDGSATKMERHSKPINDAGAYPFARVVTVQLQENRRMALAFSDGAQRGLKLEFQDAGLQRFADMCAELVRQCRW